jgi:hypothetical protein
MRKNSTFAKNLTIIVEAYIHVLSYYYYYYYYLFLTMGSWPFVQFDQPIYSR